MLVRIPAPFPVQRLRLALLATEKAAGDVNRLHVTPAAQPVAFSDVDSQCIRLFVQRVRKVEFRKIAKHFSGHGIIPTSGDEMIAFLANVITDDVPV
jgi:hypothetical protein